MASSRGLFGPIEVRDDSRVRSLLLNGQTQGSVYLEPSASSVDGALPSDAPGPVSASAYPMGWIIAGLTNPSSTGLMIGLGCGGGVAQLLYNCPGVDLTVVEIDPVMAQMALTHFPLLEWYLDRGRLDIKIADARKFLIENPSKWDFICVDSYTGGQELSADYLDVAIDRSDNHYINVIDILLGPTFKKVSNVLKEKSKPVKEVFRAAPSVMGYSGDYVSRANWILTTQDPDWSELLSFEIFNDLSGISVDISQKAWDEIVSTPLSAVV